MPISNFFTLEIEPTNICPNHCTICPSQISKRKQGFLSIDTFYQIIKKAKQYGVQHFNVAGLGEPFYHPKVAAYILELRSNFPNSRIEVFTSAFNLNDNIINTLCKAKINVLNISFYGWDKESYENTMIGMSFEETLESIKRYGLKKPENSIISILPRITKDLSYKQVNQLDRLLQESNINDYFINPRPCHNFGGYFSNPKFVDSDFFKEVHNFIPSDVTRCKVPLRNIMISGQGDIYHCYIHSFKEAPIGNINDIDLWSVEQLINLKFEDILSNGHDWSSTCMLCNAYATYGTDYYFSIQGTSSIDTIDENAREDLQNIGQMPLSDTTYWKNKLIPISQCGNFPSDATQRGNRENTNKEIEFKLEGKLHDKLNRLTRKDFFSLYNYLMAALKICIYKYSKCTHVVVGSPAYHSKSNILPILDDINSEFSFQEFRLKVKHTLIDAYVHQLYDYQSIINDINLELEDNINCLFNVSLSLKNIHREIPTSTTHLAIEVSAGKTGLLGKVIFDTSLFRTRTIKRLISNYITLIANSLDNTNEIISDLEIINKSEKRKLLADWNNNRIEYREDLCITHYIKEQVDKHPNNIAVCYQDQKITYEKLDGLSDILTNYLMDIGTKPGELIGLCVEPSIYMIIGIVGVLKAGAAYVPIDPSYPKQRIDFIINDIRANTILTQQQFKKLLPDNIRVMCLENINEMSTLNAKRNVNMGLPSNIAYVIYTSGSTGTPKGVLVTHKNLAHSTIARQNYYKESVNSFLMVSPFTFDSSIAGIFWTLCSGGTLIIASRDEVKNVYMLERLINEHEVSHLLCLPSLYELIIENTDISQLHFLRTVIVAGESCGIELVKKHFQKIPSCGLHNEYGPTEATVWSSVYDCGLLGEKQNVPIGRPIANTKIYILDEKIKPIPIGAIGEIYIAGNGVALGYLNNPELDLEMFIPNPFNPLNENGYEKLYKTGDLARYLDDGNIEFVGRSDNQVKISGYRIELEEIEKTLIQYPEIKEVIVNSKANNGGNILVAYYTSYTEKAIDISEFREFTRLKLPRHMIPSAYIYLEEFHRNPNGKIDRSALPIGGVINTLSDVSRERHNINIEEKLLQLWSKYLNIDTSDIDINESFYNIGGNSILFVRMLVDIQKMFRVNTFSTDNESFELLLQNPSIKTLERTISRGLNLLP